MSINYLLELPDDLYYQILSHVKVRELLNIDKLVKFLTIYPNKKIKYKQLMILGYPNIFKTANIVKKQRCNVKEIFIQGTLSPFDNK